MKRRKQASLDPDNQSPVEKTGLFVLPSFRGGAQRRTRKLEIRGLRFRVRAFKSAVADLNNNIAELG
jgi:hypothetical protein